MKLIVETVDGGQVVAVGVDNHAHFNRPSVVNNLHLMQLKVASGELKVLHQVNDDASDAALVEAAGKDGDYAMAVAAIAAEFPLEGVDPEPAPAKAPAKSEAKKEA